MFTTIRTNFDRWQRYKRTVGELSALSSRDLADLGIQRADIRRIAREAAQ
jgi:uncharacterized protein YjiS (DUF1127 family)